jgi:hypothetical protein
MAEMPDTEGRRRASGLRRHVAGMIALVALFVAVAAWFWKTRQGLQADAGLGVPHGVIVASAATFVAALIAQIRAMSFGEVLEAAWELLLGLFGLIGAILKGIGNWILGLFGWD